MIAICRCDNGQRENEVPEEWIGTEDCLTCGETYREPVAESDGTGNCWIICPDCEGDGTHVHDALAAPSQEMMDDSDAMDMYWSGGYDVRCVLCNGSGKVRQSQAGKTRRNITSGPLRNEAGEPLESW